MKRAKGTLPNKSKRLILKSKEKKIRSIFYKKNNTQIKILSTKIIVSKMSNKSSKKQQNRFFRLSVQIQLKTK